MKRTIDIAVSLLGLIVFAPLLLLLCLLVWIQDWHSPFYIPMRIGRRERLYRMVKIRSMVIRADTNKVDSTANNDPRITYIGKVIRKCKFDEIPQLWNVLIGDMSLVGPRPNVARETGLYTSEEKRLLIARPGITDISSIVFSDEGSILEDKADPDLAYNQLIRPYKSRFGLLYIDRASTILDFHLIFLTFLCAIDRRSALDRVALLVAKLGAPSDLVTVATRRLPLQPSPPPGANGIVQSRSA